MTTAQDDGKVVSLTHRPPLPPGNTPVRGKLIKQVGKIQSKHNLFNVFINKKFLHCFTVTEKINFLISVPPSLSVIVIAYTFIFYM